jgi:hypothetical protein
MVFKFDKQVLVAHPVHTSAFLILFLLLTFLPMIRPPVILCLLLLGGLVYLSMFFGVKFHQPGDA